MVLEGNDRLSSELERLGDPNEEQIVMKVSEGQMDPPNWVSVRLREAGNILAGERHTCAVRQVDRLLFELADRAEAVEKEGLHPLRDEKWGMVFCHATIFAAGVVEEASSAAV